MHIHSCQTRSKQDRHPYRYMSVRNPCILVQVAYQSGNFPRGRFNIAAVRSQVRPPHLTGRSWAQKDEKEMAGRESFYICKRKTVNQLWVTALWSHTGNVISRHSLPPPAERQEMKVRDRMVLLTGSRIIALEIMSVWHMHTHYVSISFNIVTSNEGRDCRWTAAIHSSLHPSCG